MTELLIATVLELRLLTKRERELYERYRHAGETREVICREMKISKDGFRRYWWSATKKIRAHREMVENPQRFLHRGKDVLRSSFEVERHAGEASAEHLSNGTPPSRQVGDETEEDKPTEPGEEGL